MPNLLRSDITYLGRTNYRQDRRLFGVRQTDRLSHLYVIGKTGVGKSTLLESIARQDLATGRGFALIDPHGDLAERVAAAAARTGRTDVVVIDAAASGQPWGYNPLKRVSDERIPLAAAGMLEALRKLWPDAWGVRMEHVLRNALYALIERDGSTLPDVLRLIGDKSFRRSVAATIRNPIVKTYWVREFEAYPERLRSEIAAPIQNKLGALLTDPRLYRFLVAPEREVSFRRTMDAGGVLIVNLSKGRLGEEGANVLGGLIVATIGLAALSRADQPGKARRPFALLVDEFQSFTTLSFVSMMAELRKYGLSLTLAHQHLAQVDERIRHTILGNAGTVLVFRLGPEDARTMSIQFEPEFGAHDLMALPNRRFLLRLMIDGTPSRPFSATLDDAS
jgi:GTPase SAR1 family protein